MNQYHIRIDGVQSPASYTYQELVDMGLFDLDNSSMNGIEVKKTSMPNFTPLKSYCFPECQSNVSSYYIDEYGQIVKTKKSNSDSSANSTSTNANLDESTEPTWNTNSPSTGPTYTSNDGWDTFLAIVGIGIAILAGIFA